MNRRASQNFTVSHGNPLSAFKQRHTRHPNVADVKGPTGQETTESMSRVTERAKSIARVVAFENQSTFLETYSPENLDDIQKQLSDIPLEQVLVVNFEHKNGVIPAEQHDNQQMRSRTLGDLFHLKRGKARFKECDMLTLMSCSHSKASMRVLEGCPTIVKATLFRTWNYHCVCCVNQQFTPQLVPDNDVPGHINSAQHKDKEQLSLSAVLAHVCLPCGVLQPVSCKTKHNHDHESPEHCRCVLQYKPLLALLESLLQLILHVAEIKKIRNVPFIHATQHGVKLNLRLTSPRVLLWLNLLSCVASKHTLIVKSNMREDLLIYLSMQMLAEYDAQASDMTELPAEVIEPALNSHPDLFAGYDGSPSLPVPPSATQELQEPVTVVPTSMPPTTPISTVTTPSTTTTQEPTTVKIEIATLLTREAADKLETQIKDLQEQLHAARMSIANLSNELSATRKQVAELCAQNIDFPHLQQRFEMHTALQAMLLARRVLDSALQTTLSAAQKTLFDKICQLIKRLGSSRDFAQSILDYLHTELPLELVYASQQLHLELSPQSAGDDDEDDEDEGEDDDDNNDDGRAEEEEQTTDPNMLDNRNFPSPDM